MRRLMLLVMAGLLVGGCERTPRGGAAEAGAAAPAAPALPTIHKAEVRGEPAEARERREALVRELEADGYVKSPKVLAAMLQVPRHLFVPEVALSEAYGDWPLPIGLGQTISQPGVVAEMTEALELERGQRVLEIGTGSGYQAAVLSLLTTDVYSIEIVRELGERATRRLRELGYSNVHVRIGDGYAGWPEHAPFDRIIVTAAPPEIPQALLDQLADGGVLVAPVGEQGSAQWLVRVRKSGDKITRERLERVRFVPMVRGK